MAVISKVVYTGALRTSATHIRSGDQIITDAPKDNNGLGEAFSPTDLLATSLASCMLTVMGIKARKLGFDLEDAGAEVEKIMIEGPRRVGEVRISINLKTNCDEETRLMLEQIGLNCPVARSLNKDLLQNISFNWK